MEEEVEQMDNFEWELVMTILNEVNISIKNGSDLTFTRLPLIVLKKILTEATAIKGEQD